MCDGEQVRHGVDEVGESSGVEQPAGTAALRGGAERLSGAGGLAGQDKCVIESHEQASRYGGEHCASAHRIVALLAGGSGRLSWLRWGDVQ